MTRPALTTRMLVQYGLIALPIAFAGFPLYVLAPDFYATRYNLSLTTLGALLLAIRLFDALQDPVIGWLADRAQGGFRPYVAGAGILLCLAVFALFNAVCLTPAVRFSLCMFAAVSAYSVLTIIMGTRATLWTPDRNDQTRIAATREAFGLAGLVVAVSMPGILARLLPRQEVFVGYGMLLFVLMAAGIFSFSRLPSGEGPAALHGNKQPVSLGAGLRALSPASLKLFAIYAVSMLASSIPAILVIFYVRDLLGAESLTGLFLLVYFVSGVIGMPLWKQASARWGKYKAWFLSNLLAVGGFVGAFFLGRGNVWLYGIVCLVSGIALGADLTMPPSILADDIHTRGNERYSGTHYAVLAFLAKASLALASALALPALDALGFKPQAVNTRDALFCLSAFYALLPSALKLAAAGLIHLFFMRSHSGGSHEDHQNLAYDRGSYHA